MNLELPANVRTDASGYALQTECGIRCAHCKKRHPNVATIRFCFEIETDVRQAIDDELRAEARNERFFEERGYEEALAQEAHEARHGVIGFMEAWHIESPDTCPCDQH